MKRSLQFPDADDKTPATQVLRNLHAALLLSADEQGKRHLVDSFSENVIHCYLSSARPPHTDAALQRLQKVEDARAELHQLELRMDKRLFAELVTGHAVARSGRDADGEMITWVGMIDNGIWNYKAGSPKGDAYVRACVWRIETTVAQFYTTLTHPDEPFVCVHDQRGRTPLDSLNIPLQNQICRLAYDLIPTSTERTVLVGASRILGFLLKVVQAWAGDRFDRFQLVDSGEDVLKLMQDPGEAPSWFTKDGSGKVIDRYDRTSVWWYERCLCDDISQKVTNREIFNPKAWPWKEGECAPSLEDVGKLYFEGECAPSLEDVGKLYFEDHTRGAAGGAQGDGDGVSRNQHGTPVGDERQGILPLKRQQPSWRMRLERIDNDEDDW